MIDDTTLDAASRLVLAVDDTPDSEGRYWVMLETVYATGDSVAAALTQLAYSLEAAIEALGGGIIAEWEAREVAVDA